METWGSCLHGLFAVREWRALDARGDVLALATGRWVVIDVARKKIIKIPPQMPAAYGEHEGRAIDDAFQRMEHPVNGVNARHFHVRFSELDTNQHANSASYVDWCLEAVPQDVLDPDDRGKRCDLLLREAEAMLPWRSRAISPRGSQNRRLRFRSVSSRASSWLCSVFKPPASGALAA